MRTKRLLARGHQRLFQVQTGSVFLNAKPEKLRCKNEFDLYRNNSFDAGAFASTKSGCGVQIQNWNNLCPDSYNLVEYNQCYDGLGRFLFHSEVENLDSVRANKTF